MLEKHDLLLLESAIWLKSSGNLLKRSFREGLFETLIGDPLSAPYLFANGLGNAVCECDEAALEGPNGLASRLGWESGVPGRRRVRLVLLNQLDAAAHQRATQFLDIVNLHRQEEH